jgi:hypothetical protein
MRTASNATVFGSGIALALAFAGSASAQNHFTGSVTYEIHSPDGKTVTVIEVQKGDKTRLEVQGAPGAAGGPTRQGVIIFDRAAGTRTMMMAERKMYITMPASTLPQVAPAATTSFEKTGKSKVIAGVPCEVYHGTGTSNGQTTEADVCIAKGVGLNNFDFPMTAGPTGGLPPEMAALKEVLKDGGAIEVVSTKNGQGGFTMTATKIDRSVPSDDQFVPPPDYHTMQMPPGMPGGLPGAMPGGLPPGAVPGGAGATKPQ